jgi:hypothetical protein
MKGAQLQYLEDCIRNPNVIVWVRDGASWYEASRIVDYPDGKKIHAFETSKTFDVEKRFHDDFKITSLDVGFWPAEKE